MIRKLLFAAIFFTAQLSFAQSKSKSRIETKTIEVEEVNGEARVTVSTNINGEKSEEVYTGEAAEKMLEKLDRPSFNSRQTSVSLHIDQDDIEEMKQEIMGLQDDISEELDKVAERIENISIDSILNAFDIEVTNTEEKVRYDFKMDGEEKRSVIIMKSSGEDEDFDFDVDVQVQMEDDEEVEHISVQKRSFLIEDNANAESTLKLKDFSVYPNPADQVLKLDFTSNSTDQIKVALTNGKGALVSTMETTGKGQKNMVMDLNDLPAGNYYLTLTQGNQQLNKKLIIK